MNPEVDVKIVPLLPTAINLSSAQITSLKSLVDGNGGITAQINPPSVEYMMVALLPTPTNV